MLVLPPEGVMEKTIEVNQSQTVNGIEVTLQRIELTSTGMTVYAFNTPPGYSLPPGQPLPAPSMVVLKSVGALSVHVTLAQPPSRARDLVMTRFSV